MEKKTSPIFIVKIILDVIMVVFLVLMYKKTAISMSFHEIGGLVIFGLFLIHNILNIRWIGSATAKLFKKGTSAKIRVSWIVNLLLFICMAGIVLTGLSMSRTLPFRISLFSGASRWHYFMAALSIILMGVHLGLHWPLIKKLITKITFLPAKIARAIGIAVLVVALVAGCYFLITGSFMRWISSPFNNLFFKVEENEEFNKRLENFDGRKFDFSSDEFSSENFPDASNVKPENMPNREDFDPSNMPNGGNFDPSNKPNSGDFDPSNMPNGGDFDPSNMPNVGDFDPSNMPNGEDFDPSNMPNSGDFDPSNMPNGGNFDSDNMPSKGDGANFPGGKNGFGEADANQGSIISNIFKVILTYGTEIIVFAFITVMLSKIKKKSDDDESEDDEYEDDEYEDDEYDDDDSNDDDEYDDDDGEYDDDDSNDDDGSDEDDESGEDDSDKDDESDEDDK